VSVERIASELDDSVHGSPFLEQMSGTWDDDDLGRTSQTSSRGLVQGQHLDVSTTDDEQRWRTDLFQRVSRQVRPAPSRDHQLDSVRNLGGGLQSGSRSRARAEQSQRQSGGLRPLAQPANRIGQP